MANHSTATEATPQEQLYRIGEVGRLTELKPFVLRYWESEFPMLRPVKGARGQRMYRQEDVDLVFRIKRLLYDEGYTIAGARRHLREGGNDSGMANSAEGPGQVLSRKMLLDLRDGLRAFLTLLERR